MAAAVSTSANSAEGEVTHLRLPPELKDAMKTVAQLKGRSLTQHIVLILDEAHFGPRELRLIQGKLGKN